MLADFGLGFWFGSKLIEDKIYNYLQDRNYTVGDVISVFFSVLFSAFSLGALPPFFKSFSDAKHAAAELFGLIDRVPEILIDDKTKENMEKIETDIVLRNVSFQYQKGQSKILKNVSISILKNKRNAFVGHSGCGKTTIFQLLERFYDPDEGYIEINGKDIRDYNLKSLRNKIGYVGQEPVLFATTIR